MILKEFKTGWQSAFENKLASLTKIFPDITLNSIYRYHGMLRIKFQALDKDTQFVVDCVTYKIERESSKICESCGKYATRKEEFLPEKMCLCWKCYALEIDALKSSES